MRSRLGVYIGLRSPIHQCSPLSNELPLQDLLAENNRMRDSPHRCPPCSQPRTQNGVHRHRAWPGASCAVLGRGEILKAQDASHDPEPIMLDESAARRDPTLQAILRSEVGLEAYDSAQLARQAPSLSRRIGKTMPSGLRVFRVWGWKLLGSHVRNRYVSVELSRHGRLNLSMSTCHLSNPPDVRLQTSPLSTVQRECMWRLLLWVTVRPTCEIVQ